MKPVIKKRLTALDIYKTSSMPERYATSGIKLGGYFDIETTDFNPQFGFILTISVVIRDMTKKNRIFKKLIYRVKQKEILEAALKKKKNIADKRILTEFLRDLKKYKIDALFGWYSNGRHKFDMPFVRSRALLLGIEELIPSHKTMRYIDLWNVAKNILKSQGYSLDKIGQITGATSSKTKVEGEIWWKAHYGDKESLDYVQRHNEKDTMRTLQIHKKIERMANIPLSYI